MSATTSTTAKNWDNTKMAFSQLCQTIAALRHPVTGCPWDLEQTHATLRRYMLEEAYEAAEVMDPADPTQLKDELGDVLLQVMLNSQLAADAGTFTIQDVIEGLDAKMRRRHPHVFGIDGNPKDLHSRDRAKIKEMWQEVKSKETPATNKAAAGVFSQLKAGTVTPALNLTVAIGKIARKIAFDWDTPLEVFDQLQSEVIELQHELTANKSAVNDNRNRIVDELSDVFFSLGQLCRHLDIDPEVCAMDGNKKFLRRFQSLETIARLEGVEVSTAGTATLEALWKRAKALEKQEAAK